ncbi:hypothetical protein SS1G_05757 [Sclerotinia sclerotiorum 1980 UF-70]|uniref:Amino acid permease/ SLC12A domain-containing protein n=2 Tax=Sclerotinia sclerotiorum (strain ATCC 18683 / 1980 / Ss-1) TaxID=665079 RepID=A7EKB0_SCLS1|nr:hypothetical protein SS1G_05757 [Sclerotinia sclerotiorum 1980 UF-70]APA09978.1 hypothetical protein sscle_05g047480 [Sclerotinia sclerotiorum 1980 UF-70]EDO03276.1 hypothetical protein SS1G_05757 [Sclerotinia sclerotiorum 1980 UF-70]
MVNATTDMNKSCSTTTSSTVVPLLVKPKETRKFPTKTFDNFRSDAEQDVEHPIYVGTNGRTYNDKAAASNTANTNLVRILRGRHLQMLAIGGSIGTGLFVSSGAALASGGPGSLLLAYILTGGMLYCTVQALGEMAVTFPIAGSFSTFATRFIDPAWGFATGWNYAIQCLIIMPVELMAAAITLEYWDLPIPTWASITLFLASVAFISLCGIKTFGEAEYAFSILKVTAIIGFILLGIVINCTGTPQTGYIGVKYWIHPGAFNHGFKGFCNILVMAAFSFAGTELVALAAAETYNPSKSLPTAIKQVFWRIVLFYILSIFIIGLLVPYNTPSLLSTSNASTNKASPFIIAIQSAGINGLDSVMNAVILIAVLSVANSCVFGSSRLLASLAAQGQAPRYLAYIDRKGRPIIAVFISLAFGLLAYLYVSSIGNTAFTWLLALSGLSSLFTWGTICYSHIRFRKAWAQQGHRTDSLIYQSPVGTIGSWVGLIMIILVLAAQFWVAVDPIGDNNEGINDKISGFFEAYLALPVVLMFYAGYKLWYRTRWMKIEAIDLRTGRNDVDAGFLYRGSRGQRWEMGMEEWPRWKKIYKLLC